MCLHNTIREFKQWKVRREAELQSEEERKLNVEYNTMRSKVQSEIDLVKRKLEEEKNAKMQQVELEIAEKNRVSEICGLRLPLCSILVVLADISAHLKGNPGGT